jgi:hypothetical protein
MRPDRKSKAINSPSTTAKSPTTCNLHQFQLLSRYFSPLHLLLALRAAHGITTTTTRLLAAIPSTTSRIINYIS